MNVYFESMDNLRVHVPPSFFLVSARASTAKPMEILRNAACTTLLEAVSRDGNRGKCRKSAIFHFRDEY